jgi:toxin ParE1/3/4
LRPDLGAGILGFPVEDYVIFYRQVSTGIEVVRVLHGARDIEALFHDTETGAGSP